MTVISDVQKLEPGSIIELFELDAREIGGEVQYFHGSGRSPVFWQGNEYSPWAIEASGFALTGDGQQPAPVLSVGNIGEDADGNTIPGIISSLCLALDDLVGAKLIRHRTFVKNLDAENFPDGNPSADPTDEFRLEVWLIEAKTSETAEVVEFELKSALDFSGQQLPRCQIVANVCQWLQFGGYRGSGCNYVGSAMFDRNDNPVTDPTQDKCAGLVSSCQKRFAAQQGVTEIEAVINIRAFPAADITRGY